MNPLTNEDIRRITKESIDASNLCKDSVLIQVDASPPIVMSTTKVDIVSVPAMDTQIIEEKEKEEKTTITLLPTLQTPIATSMITISNDKEENGDKDKATSPTQMLQITHIKET